MSSASELSFERRLLNYGIDFRIQKARLASRKSFRRERGYFYSQLHMEGIAQFGRGEDFPVVHEGNDPADDANEFSALRERDHGDLDVSYSRDISLKES